jgi:hypothetical protein
MVDDAGADDALDRAAILARRQRFIALALSGLGAACGDGSGGPQPCLDVAPQTESGTAEAGTSTSAADTGSSSSGTPMPCLDVAPQTSSETGPADTTDATTSTTGTTGTTGSDSTSTGG